MTIARLFGPIGNRGRWVDLQVLGTVLADQFVHFVAARRAAQPRTVHQHAEIAERGAGHGSGGGAYSPRERPTTGAARSVGEDEAGARSDRTRREYYGGAAARPAAVCPTGADRPPPHAPARPATACASRLQPTRCPAACRRGGGRCGRPAALLRRELTAGLEPAHTGEKEPRRVIGLQAGQNRRRIPAGCPAGQRDERRRWLGCRWHIQAFQRQQPFLAQTQPCPPCRQQLERRRGLEQLKHEGGGARQVFDVVQHKQ